MISIIGGSCVPGMRFCVNMNHHNVNMMYLINERVNRECLLAEEAVAVEEYLNMQNQVSKVVQNLSLIHI